MATVKKTSTPKKAAAKESSSWDGIVAYDVKTKTKAVPMLEAVISIKNNKYVATGVSEEGNKLAAIMNQAKAEAFIASGHATKGEGWPTSKKK